MEYIYTLTASYKFLLLILVGVLLNIMYLLVLSSKESTLTNCAFEYLFDHLVI